VDISLGKDAAEGRVGDGVAVEPVATLLQDDQLLADEERQMPGEVVVLKLNEVQFRGFKSRRAARLQQFYMAIILFMT
jgi:hypothetical protein